MDPETGGWQGGWHEDSVCVLPRVLNGTGFGQGKGRASDRPSLERGGGESTPPLRIGGSRNTPGSNMFFSFLAACTGKATFFPFVFVDIRWEKNTR